MALVVKQPTIKHDVNGKNNVQNHSRIGLVWVCSGVTNHPTNIGQIYTNCDNLNRNKKIEKHNENVRNMPAFGIINSHSQLLPTAITLLQKLGTHLPLPPSLTSEADYDDATVLPRKVASQGKQVAVTGMHPVSTMSTDAKQSVSLSVTWHGGS